MVGRYVQNTGGCDAVAPCRPIIQYTAMQTLKKWVGLLLVALIVIGCQAAVVTPTPEPEPEPLTLQDTWIETSTWTEDDGTVISAATVLTLTSDRAVTYNAEYNAADGELIDWWWSAGTWTATDDTVTRTWLDDHDDDDETPDVMREHTRAYHWGEERQSVFMAWWNDDDPGDDIVRYERSELPALVGTWVWRRNPDAWTQSVTLTINADGTFQAASVGGNMAYRVLAGDYVYDSETQAMTLSNLTWTVTPEGGETTTEDFVPDGPFRYVFAATDDPDVIMLSPPHLDTREPYGVYVDLYDRQS